MNRMGYACINMQLSNQKPRIYTGRSMIKRTFKSKGIEYASELGLQNTKDLFKNTSKEPINIAIKDRVKCQRRSSK